MSESQCCICYDDYKDPITAPCGHTFCYECILHWVERAGNCPLCKQAISYEQLVGINRQNRTTYGINDRISDLTHSRYYRIGIQIILPLLLPFIIIAFLLWVMNNM
ncbi:RING-type domain-containing protein [Entamoeba marina]